MPLSDWLQNVWVILGLGAVVWLVVHGARSDRWQRAFLRLRRDKFGVAAGAVIALYLFIGALEMLQVPLGHGESSSILQLLTRGVAVEKTFSAPLATHTLNSQRPEPLQ